MFEDMLPHCDILIHIRCPHCRSTTESIASLGHIYVATPSDSVTIELSPLVTWAQTDAFVKDFEDPDESAFSPDKSNLGYGNCVDLPADSLLSISLP